MPAPVFPMAPSMTTTTLGADMFQAMGSYVKDYKDALAAAKALRLPQVSDLDAIVLAGMGGSGIGADLAAGLARETCPRPLVVLKDYRMPRYVGKKSLVIATSYSGETEETLFAVSEAHARGALVAGVASGGTLAAFLKRHKLPFYAAPANRQPRAALPFLFGGVAGMLAGAGVTGFELSNPEENVLQNRHVRLQPRLAGTDDEALKYAQQLRNAAPAIYGEGHLAAVATRWKCQLNENSKIFARAETLPEANHNDLVAWAHGPRAEQDLLVTLRRPDEPREVRTRFEFLTETARNQGFPIIPVQAACRTPVGQCLELLMVGDYASVYTAVLRGVDPTPVHVIAELKKRLAQSGLAGEAKKRLGP